MSESGLSSTKDFSGRLVVVHFKHSSTNRTFIKNDLNPYYELSIAYIA